MRFRVPGRFNKPVVEDEAAPENVESSIPHSKEGVASDVQDTGSDGDQSSTEYQHGDEAIRAVTQMWTRRDLIIAYALIWIICFIQAFSSSIIYTLTPYVTSNFNAHSMTATVSIPASIISGVIKLPYAKLMNIWGRPQAFGLCIVIMTMGLIMLPACPNVATYAAALVFYQVGYSTIDFTCTIFIADTSQLKSRAFMIAFAGSPYLATVWAYGPAAQSILDRLGFRWGLGIWAIIYPIATVPLFGLFYYYQWKAQKAGLLKRESSGRTVTESIKHWAIQFDVIGIFLLSAGLVLFLLAFALYSYQPNTWKSPLTICFLVIGGLLVISFTLWEKFLAPVTFVPWYLITNRTVFFTYTMVASIYTAWYIWNNYFYSMLVVVFHQSVTHATYISNIYTMGSCFMALVIGAVIRVNGRLKWHALYFGVPLTALGVGLMIHFRQPDVDIGYIVMCQIFIAFGGGILVICEQMTVMAVSTQRDIPAVLAVESMISSIGGSIGDAIAAAMWTGIFPAKLMKYLPSSALDNFANIYGDMTVQSSYPIGSPTRDAIEHAYGDAQRLMLIAACSLYTITLVSVMMWKSINVKNITQLKGTVW
ncbi:hypothetical protein NW762_014599 [Fusarium torreyae]|uniref:Siderophore iron transporter mirB n=1 Tax=Fusarium torreyae TaxID=1237075 RepID=A0A9W8RIK6_9HYPO|nr:hypothetical protein NW762_014599 [Fusarium torreyae]